MKRPWAAMAAFVLAACGSTSGHVVCGACPGPGYVASGLPDDVHHGVVRVCVGDEPCTTTRLHGSLPPHTQQYVQLPDTATSWERYDGTRLTADFRSGGRRWSGSGTLRYTEGGDDPCSCSYLTADVTFERVSRPG